MKLTEEIEEFINLTITEHMGKEYAEWKIKQQSVAEPDKVEEEYEKVIASLSPEQEEAITKYCDAIFSSGADTEEFFYRLGLKDGLKLRKVIKSIFRNWAVTPCGSIPVLPHRFTMRDMMWKIIIAWLRGMEPMKI